MSDGNKILADMVKDVGLEYVGKVIEQSLIPSSFIRKVFENGLTPHESCAAKAGAILFELGMQYGRIDMSMNANGVTYRLLNNHGVTIDWLMMYEADIAIIRQHVVNELLPNAFPLRYHRAALGQLG